MAGPIIAGAVRTAAAQAGRAALKQGAVAPGQFRAWRARFWRNVRGAFDATLNAGWQLNLWSDLFSETFPSVVNTVRVTTVGQKGTPAKNVLHVALAAAFGCLARGVPSFGDIGLRVEVDHMNNAVQVEYAVRVGMLGAALPSILPAVKDIATGVATYGLRAGAALARNVVPVIPGSANIVRPPGPRLPPGNGVGMDAPGAKDAGPASQAPLKDQVKKSFNAFYNLNLADALWGDPKSAWEATNFGSLAKEVVQAGLPPASLVPSAIIAGEAKFPAPYVELVGPLVPFLKNQNPATASASGAEIVTRLPTLQDGKTPAANPLPPVPRKPAGAWKYAQQPDLLAVPAELGYPFDLRTLVAQALSDPGVVQPVPETNLALPPGK